MSKLKSGKCLYCKQPIKRHDANRVEVVVGEDRGSDRSHKQAYVACLPESKGGDVKVSAA